MQSASETKQNTFAEDILEGLEANPKYFSSKYFYDDEGSRLFQEIMKLPEYYLTRSEYEILSRRTAAIFDAFEAGAGAFDLIELGAGDGSKTALLVEYFLGRKVDFRYVPLDISSEALNVLSEKFKREFPGLDIRPEQGDYFKTLETFAEKSERKKIILFLGSNVGNFSEEEALAFFTDLRKVMNERDFLFVGFDLHKNPQNDSERLRRFAGRNGEIQSEFIKANQPRTRREFRCRGIFALRQLSPARTRRAVFSDQP